MPIVPLAQVFALTNTPGDVAERRVLVGVAAAFQGLAVRLQAEPLALEHGTRHVGLTWWLCFISAPAR